MPNFLLIYILAKRSIYGRYGKRNSSSAHELSVTLEILIDRRVLREICPARGNIKM